jgi:hypothetical protein
MPLQLPPHEAARRRRRRQSLARRRRLRFFTLLALLLLVVGAFSTVALAGRITRQVPSSELLVADSSDGSGPVSGTARPFFARLRGQNLVLPVPSQDATVIAYQPAGDERAIPLDPVGRQINGSVVSRSIQRVLARKTSVQYYVLKGTGRVVAPTGAVDVGAAPGTVITSPVSGEVTGVKKYRLLGKYDDIQIDIRPAKVSGVTVTLLFVAEPAVTIGQEVVAGSTQLGKVRGSLGDLGARLSEYTHDTGSHVHLQVTQDPTAE